MRPPPLRTLLVVAFLGLGGVACGDDLDDRAEPTPDAGGDCSAGELAVAAVELQGVTEAVARTYDAVRSAALDCDYPRLADLAPDDGFQFSFGGGDDPAAFWRRAEDSGEPVMADLVQILGLPAAEDDDGNDVWPRVHLEPEDDAAWDEIAGIYEPEDVSAWREFGGYFGYRTAIAPDGTWLYFVAGD